MIEPEKKGSPWPWILVPVAAVSLFFVLRQCRQNLPPAESIETAEVAEPAAAEPAAASVSEPTPQ